MVTIKKLFGLVLLFCFTSSSIFANNGIEDGWKFFAANELDNAEEAFRSALGGSDAAEAHLGISLTAAAKGISSRDIFEHHAMYYDLAKDPQLTLLGLWSMGGGKKSEAEVEFLEKLVKNEKGTLKALALQALGEHYYSANKHKKSQEYFNQVGAIENWSVVGTFENISESGFAKDFGAIDHPEPRHIFKDKRGIDVKWFDIKAPKYNKWVDMTYFFYTDNSVVYAQNYCISPKEQEVQFRLGVSGSAKVWVNDKLLFSEDHERNNDLDSYIFTAKLNKGANRIVVQLGQSEIRNCNFLLRITDNEGENIPGLNFETIYQGYKKEMNYESNLIENEIEKHFLNQIAENEKKINNYLVLIQHYIYSDQTFNAKKILKQAKSHFPDCSYITSHQLRANLSDGNTTMINTLKEEIKQKDPNNSLALSLLFDEAMDREDYDEAKKVLERIEDKEGRTANILELKIRLKGATNEREEMFKLIKEGYDKYPDNYTFVYYKYILHKDVDKNINRGIKVLKKFLNNHYRENAQIELASAYFKANNVTSGLSTYQKLVENNPIAVGYYSNLASMMYSMGNYKKANEYAEECLAIAPYIGSYHQTIAKTHAELGQTDKAREAYEKAIYYDAYNYEAREQLRQLDGNPDIFTSFEEPDIDQIFADSPKATDYPEDNSIILLDEVQQVAYEKGGSEQRHFVLIKTFNSAGVDRWKEYSIPLYDNQSGTIEKIEIIKVDGSRIAAENNGTHVVFSNLEAGDAIYLNYRIQDYYSGKLAKHIWGTHYFSYSYPVVTSKYSIMLPKSKHFDYKLSNNMAKVTFTDESEGDTNLFVWEANNVPSIKHESYMPSMGDVSTILHYSSFPDWGYIAEWYADLSKAKSKVDFEVKELEAEIFGDNKQRTDREKVQAIYDYIVNDIHYRSIPFIQSGLVPQRASTTISARQGDCKDVSTLFVALCETQGISANLVLVNTLDNGQKEMMLPSINFNHCMANVELDGESYVIELTSENLPFASQWDQTVGAFTLDIPVSAEERKNVKPVLLAPNTRQKNEVKRQTKVKFDGNTMVVEKNTRKTGAAAASMRDTYESLGAEQRHKNMQEAVMGDKAGVKLVAVEFADNLNTITPELDYTYTYKISDAFAEISGLQIFEIPWADALHTPDFLSLDERKYPVDLWMHALGEEYEETVVIQIPQGKKVSEVPANVSLSTPEIDFSISYAVKGQTLEVVRKFEYHMDRVEVSRFDALKKTLNQVIKEDTKKLAFVNEG